MKFSVSTYSFRNEISQFDCIAAAKEMGYDAIEICEINPHDGSSREDYARKLGEECARLGMPVSNFTVGADLLYGCDGDRDREVERLCREVDIAVLLGAKSMRHDAAWTVRPDDVRFRTFGDVLPYIAEGCRQVTAYAESVGVRTMVENHGFFCQDSHRVEALVTAVAHRNFGLLLDMGNFLCADEAPEHAFGLLAPFASYIHAKDFIVKPGSGPNPGRAFFKSRGGNYLRGTIVGHGSVPVSTCLSILAAAGYDGFVGVEFEGIEPMRDALTIGLENLRNYHP